MLEDTRQRDGWDFYSPEDGWAADGWKAVEQMRRVASIMQGALPKFAWADGEG